MCHPIALCLKMNYKNSILNFGRSGMLFLFVTIVYI